MLLTCGTTSKLVLAQPVAEVARHAVEERVAAADQHRAPGARAPRAPAAGPPACRGRARTFRAGSRLEQPERRGGAQDQVGLGHGPPRRLGQAGQPVVADPHDHQLRSCVRHRRCPRSRPQTPAPPSVRSWLMIVMPRTTWQMANDEDPRIRTVRRRGPRLACVTHRSASTRARQLIALSLREAAAASASFGQPSGCRAGASRRSAAPGPRRG